MNTAIRTAFIAAIKGKPHLHHSGNAVYVAVRRGSGTKSNALYAPHNPPAYPAHQTAAYWDAK